MLEIKSEKSEWHYPVVPTEAINNKNIDVLFDKIEAFLDYSINSGHFESHRREQIKKKIISILQYRLNELVRDRLSDMADIDKMVLDIYNGQSDPYTASDKLFEISQIK